VGEAIAAMGSGNISDAVSVVGVGKLQDGYLDLLQNTVDVTKDLMGATESALGAEQANNTSAILALQETSRVPLRQVRSSLHKCLEELANIWADMMCAYYPAERLLVTKEGNELQAIPVDLAFLRKAALCARVDLCETSRLNASSSQTVLDKLLSGAHISASEYISRLPAGLIPERDELLAKVKEREKSGKEESVE
jgi:hypothetical protein